MIAEWSEGVAEEHMAEAILLELGEVVRRHPWWQARGELTRAILRNLGIRPPARVCDAGCGWGATLESLEGAGYRVSGLDISRAALRRLDRPGRELAVADLTRPLPEPTEPFDAALALDVLEHLDDDRPAARNLARLVRPGGVAIISVPARPDLFSEFDAIQGHRRRYTPGRLRSAFDGSGLEVERIFFWGAWMVPLLHRQRRGPKRSRPDEPAAVTYRRYLRVPPWPAPLLLHALFALERGRSIAGRLRTGTSLFAIARRPRVNRPARPVPPPHGSAAGSRTTCPVSADR